MKKTSILLCALVALISGGCMTQTQSEQKVDESISKSAVSSLNDSARKLLDTFRDQSQDLYDELREINEKEMSSDTYTETKKKLTDQFEQLYEGELPAYEQTYEALKSDPELRKSLEALKDQTQEIYKQITGSDQKEGMDLSKLTEAMKNFEGSYMKANNLR